MRVLTLTTEHEVNKRLDLVLELYQAYAVPSGLYAAHVWGTSFLKFDQLFKSRIQIQHRHFLRQLIRARQGTSHWCLLHEMGQKPFQYYWWRMVISFWNAVLISNSPLLLDTIRSEAGLCAEGCTSGWIGEVREALQQLPGLPIVNDEGLVASECLLACKPGWNNSMNRFGGSMNKFGITGKVALRDTNW